MKERTNQSSTIVGDEPCPSCREKGGDKSGNHLLVFSNGNKYCNRCGYKEIGEAVQLERKDGMWKVKGVPLSEVASLPFMAITDRKISQSTSEHFKVRTEVSEANGEPYAHYYEVVKDGKVCGYKKRTLPKTFSSIGDSKGTVELFGQSVCPQSGKRLLITGGELDALAAYQMLKEKYPQYTPAVVSLPKGENASAVKDNLEFVNSFDEVLIYTDMDEVGRKVADELAKLIGFKAKIVKTSEKDACDMLVKGKKNEFISSYYDAEGRKPKGIVTGASISLDRIRKATIPGYMTGYTKLDKMLGGLRKAELTTLTAGSGIGKSTLARELGYRLRVQDLCIGNLFLEEPLEKTIQGYIAIDNNVKLSSLRANPNLLTTEQWTASYNKLIAEKWIGLEHFGSLPTEDLMDKMRYLAYGEHCDFIILDHLSLVMSGQASDNERKDIDMVMTELAAFVNESGVGILSVVHLSRNKGKTSFNEGGQVSLNDLRGSAALEQLSWNVLALERDQQDASVRDQSQIRILKAREEGWTGVADTCKYDMDTGRLVSIPDIQLSGDY